MPQETHIKTNTHKILLVIIFILVIGFGFGKGEKAEAETTERIGTCQYSCNLILPGYTYVKDISEAKCTNICKNIEPNGCGKDVFDGEILNMFSKGRCKFYGNNDSLATTLTYQNTPRGTTPDSCSGTDWVHIMDCTLLALLKFFVWLATLAGVLFGWIMKPENITSILSSNAIYGGWTLVRDALNVSFIMFLLFSAFATVFQIDKYSYKKTLLMIVIMALLVNFSFPISRFIIDVSNMMMFYFSTTLGIGIDGAETFVNFAGVSGLPGILKPSVGANTTALLAAVVFVFIFTVTILTISVLFLIRTIALAVLIIFSSLAFVGAAIPPLSSYASDWWKKLFSYAFFGPIMLFMMYIASSLMNEIGKSGNEAMKTLAEQNSFVPETIATLSFFAIPIVILWMGLGIAQSMSIHGAGAVVGKAQGFMKGVGNWTARAPYRGLSWTARQTGIPGGLQQKWQNWQKTGRLFGSDAREAREAAIAGRGPFAVANVIDQANLKRIDEAKKRLNIDNISEADLRGIATTGNQHERAAAIQKLAELGSATQADLDYVRTSFRDTSQVFMQLVNKVKAYDPTAAFSHLFDGRYGANAPQNDRWREMMQSHFRSNQFDAKKLNANSLGNDNFMGLAFQNQAISNTDLEDLRKKSIAHENSITASLGIIGANFANLNQADPNLTPQQLRINRNVQMAHFAQTGGFHNSITNNQNHREQIISRLDKDTAKRINSNTIRNYADDLANNIRTNRYKNIVLSMDDEAAQREINTAMQNTNQTSPTAQNINRLASRDHDLMHIHN